MGELCRSTIHRVKHGWALHKKYSYQEERSRKEAKERKRCRASKTDFFAPFAPLREKFFLSQKSPDEAKPS
jgi:hypothetical protein